MLLGFKKRFRDPILIGTKVFTMRTRRKKMPKIGEQLHMYTGLRTKHTEVITKKEKLFAMQNVRLTIKLQYNVLFDIRIWVDRRELSQQEIDQFVVFDGFRDRRDFAEYWLTDEKGKPKKRTGAMLVMFHWTDLKY